MLDPVRVQQLLNERYTFTCAHCVHLHRARERGHKLCIAHLARKECSGPFNGQAYPEYVGPIPRDAMVNMCFLCGALSAGAAEVPDPKSPSGKSLIGLCDAHIVLMDGMSKPEEPPPFITHKKLNVLE